MPERRKELLVFYERTRRRISMDKVKPRTLAYFSVMLLLIGLAGGLYLHQASEVAAYAKEIRRLQTRKDRLHRELVVLEGEAAVLGSLERVMRSGKDLGYHFPEAADVEKRLTIECTPTPRARQAHALPLERKRDFDNVGLNVNNTLWENLVHRFYLWLEAPVDQR
ncbi:MAG: hypothetical protein U9R48_09650 [Chloroflexota bacterium]|nr:hypothetical protein [Chloroflexota bacterium]